jgi:hypothetical protein
MIVVTCGKCQSRIKAKPEYAGRKVKCPKCQGPVKIPQAEVARPSDTPAESQAVNEAANPTPEIGDTVSQPPTVSPPVVIPPVVTNDVPASFPDLSTPVSTEEVPTFPSPVAGPTFPSEVDVGGGVQGGVGDVVVSAGGGESVSYTRKKSGGGAGVIVVGSVLLFGLAGAGAWWLGYFKGDPKLVVKAVDDQEVKEEESLQLSISVESRGQYKRFLLADGPEGAIVDKSGKFFWTPTEKQGPGEFEAKIKVFAGDQDSEVAFSIAVAEVNQPPAIALISNVEVAPGQVARFQARATDSDLPPADLRYELGDDAPDGAKIDPATGAFTWATTESDADSKTLLTVVARESGDDGLKAETTVSISVSGITDPYRLLLATLRKQDEDVEERPAAKVLPFTGAGHLLRINDEDVHVFVYGTSFEIGDDLKRDTF